MCLLHKCSSSKGIYQAKRKACKTYNFYKFAFEYTLPTKIFAHDLGISILPANVGRIELRSINKDKEKPSINYHPL